MLEAPHDVHRLVDLPLALLLLLVVEMGLYTHANLICCLQSEVRLILSLSKILLLVRLNLQLLDVPVPLGW